MLLDFSSAIAIEIPVTMLLYLLLGFPAFWLVYSQVCLYLNIQRARKLGLPIRVLPVSPMNLFWVVSEPLVFGIIDRLPFRLGSLSRYGLRAWHFKEKAQSHVEMGDAFSIVSPGEIFIYLSDPVAITDVFSRRADFARPLEIYQMLAVYGSNVSTVGWTDWQRQRKIVAAPFNENTNKLVWCESLSQTKDMLCSWMRCGGSGAQGTASDTRTLSLDVLAATGFRKSYKFYASTERGDSARSYRQSLKTVMDNSIFMMVAPPQLLAMPIFPEKWNMIAQATRDFKNYTMDMLNEELRLLKDGKPGTGSLMTSLVRESEEHKKEHREDGPKPLSVSEILGNVFVINFAGHDTTANTLAYAIMLLAAHPDVQDWIGEELRTALGQESSETWHYERLFPQLKRCQAILLETIRLYPPIMALPKTTHGHSQTLEINGRSVVVPPWTYILPSLLAVQTHPKYWSPDPVTWRPSRWIVTSQPSSESIASTIPEQLKQEELFIPLNSTYFPWSAGPQYCPGKKFAQVEFVAVMARLFRDNRVRPALHEGETQDAGSKRALAVCEDSEHVLLLRMRDANSIKLIWETAA